MELNSDSAKKTFRTWTRSISSSVSPQRLLFCLCHSAEAGCVLGLLPIVLRPCLLVGISVFSLPIAHIFQFGLRFFLAIEFHLATTVHTRLPHRMYLYGFTCCLEHILYSLKAGARMLRKQACCANTLIRKRSGKRAGLLYHQREPKTQTQMQRRKRRTRTAGIHKQFSTNDYISVYSYIYHIYIQILHH